jgi:predicted Zn-dependent protease
VTPPCSRGGELADRDDLEVVFDRLRNGSDVERDSLLRQLSDRAEASQSLEDWHVYAMGLLTAGRESSGVDILSQLVQAAAGQEPADIYRYNLAVALQRIGQTDLASYHLRELAERGVTEKGRDLGAQGLDTIAAGVAGNEEERHFQELRAGALMERVAGGGGTEGDHHALAEALLKLDVLDEQGSHLLEGIAALEEGRARYPESVPLLELLVLALLRLGDQPRIERALADLERLAPDSPALAVLRKQQEEDAAEYSDELEGRAEYLLRETQSGDLVRARAAVEGLGQIVKAFPSNPAYRDRYAFALMVIGDYEAAVREAEVIERTGTDSHELHLLLGQIYLAAGQEARGRRHLDLALRYARTDQDRVDVRFVLEQWEARAER